MTHTLFDYVDCEFFYLKNIIDNLNLNDDYNVIAGIIHTKKEAKDVLNKIDPNKKNILIQISEETEGPYYSDLYDMFYKVFRTYNNNGKIDNKKIFPIPCGHISRFLSKSIQNEVELPILKNINERVYDIFFTGQHHQGLENKERYYCNENIKKLKTFKTLTSLTNGFGQGYDLNQYYSILNNSKISAVPCGYSVRESFRFFESFMMGCIVVTTLPFNSDDYTNIWYYKNCPAIYIPSWDCLNEELLTNILENQEDIFNKNLKYYKNSLSLEAVGKYITSKILETE
jgi:hypothetical protein